MKKALATSSVFLLYPFENHIWEDEEVVHLEKWFLANKRPLPWREKKTPYKVWISEIMLQQTQVKTVLEYYKRWLKEFPDIKKLASSKEEKILRLWQGLGYYSRARNILKSAKIILEKYGGDFPKDYSDMITLPGIGDYTAGAISSLAFNQREAMVDGNIERVIVRLLAIEIPLKIIRQKKIIWRILKNNINKNKKLNVPIFNEALMELGAVTCTPKSPSCPSCPWKTKCLSFKKKIQELLPARIRTGIEKVYSTAAIVSNAKGEFLLSKRASEKRLKDMWEFPVIEHHAENIKKSEITAEFEKKKFNLKIKKYLGYIYHSYTKYKIKLSVYDAEILKKSSVPQTKTKWQSLDTVDELPLSSANHKVIKKFLV